MKPEYQYIYQVYLDGSFSKAAEKLYLTQPALSIAIQKVENAIGAPLFDRSKRPLELTSVGEAYIQVIRQVSQLERELDQRIEDIKGLQTGVLRIGGSHYINSYILPDVFTGFSNLYPGVKLEIFESSPARLVTMLADQAIDVTFSAYGEDENHAHDFHSIPAFYDYILLAVPVGFKVNSLPELGGAALSPQDIRLGRHLEKSCPAVPLSLFKEEEFILLSEGNNLHDRALMMIEEAAFEPKVKLTLSQMVTAYHLSEHRLGITFVSDRQIRPGPSGLCFYKLDSPWCDRTYNLLLRRSGYIPFPVRRFIQYCVDSLRTQP